MIKNAIKRELCRRKMSMNHLALITGLSYSTIRNICIGKTEILNCPYKTLRRIADALDLSVDELFANRVYQYSIHSVSKERNIEKRRVLLCEFLDAFSAASDQEKKEMVFQEPEDNPDQYEMAAIVHKLSLDNNFAPPQWVNKSKFIAEVPVYGQGIVNEEYRKYLEDTAPEAYKMHNVFMDENSIRRY